MTTTTLKYNLHDFDNIAHSGGMEYTLDSSVLAVLDKLCKEIGYDPLTTANTFVNHYNAQRIQRSEQNFHSNTHSHGNYKKRVKTQDDNWKTSHSFKPTTLGSNNSDTSSVQHLANETRTILNKMTNKNRDAQIEQIMAKILEIRCCAKNQEELDANMDKALSLIYSVCQGNRTYSENYAYLWKQLKKQYPADVDEYLSKQWISYKNTFSDIVDVSSDDYDLYCENVAKTDKRINQTHLFCQIAKKDAFSVDKIFDFLCNELVVGRMNGGEIDNKENTKKIEEYVENMIIAFGILEQEFSRIDDYEDNVLPILEEIVESKRPGLSNRAKFKLMDLLS